MTYTFYIRKKNTQIYAEYMGEMDNKTKQENSVYDSFGISNDQNFAFLLSRDFPTQTN